MHGCQRLAQGFWVRLMQYTFRKKRYMGQTHAFVQTADSLDGKVNASVDISQTFDASFDSQS